MINVPRILGAVFSTVFAGAVLWLHRTTAGLIVASVFALITVWIAAKTDVDGLFREAREGWAAYKNPTQGGKP